MTFLSRYQTTPPSALTVAPSKVLYISECSTWGRLGFKAVADVFLGVTPLYWSHGMPKPNLKAWTGDWIISFKSDLILSRTTIENAKKGAINFHPAPPKYRGLGGYWWALNNKDKSYGVTAHYMDEKIDHGAIIETLDFPISSSETVDELKEMAAMHSLRLLKTMLVEMSANKSLKACGTEWASHLYTSQELAQAQATYQPAVTALNAVRSDAENDGLPDSVWINSALRA